jgi:ABC-type phosphate transport system permease subunit
MSADYHRLAKEAGNRLKAYILAYASGATGIFFLALSGERADGFEVLEIWLLIFALLMFVLTVVLCLLELHIDARRFFYVAKQLESPETARDWAMNEKYKKFRIWLIYGSYVTVGIATLASVIFLVSRIT